MGHKALFVEAKVLEQLQSGSYEEILSVLDRAVSESQDKFGSEAVLFATYPDRVVVLSEDGVFHSVKYEVVDGVAKLGRSERVMVSTLSEQDVVNQGVDCFLEGGELANAMRGVMSLRSGDLPLDRVTESLGQLFSRGRIWKKVVHEHRQSIGSYAWDADYGSLEVTVRPLFGRLLEGGEEELDEEVSGEVTDELIDLEGRLGEMLSRVHVAHEELVSGNVEMRDEELDAVTSQFDSFVVDYSEHLGDVVECVSNAIRDVRDGGCVLCGAKIHDEIALRYRDFDLGSRFVRKVAGALA